jgi:AcrR family transcriptional regulator
MPPVKQRRPYDSSLRRQRAEQNREAILDAARAAFAETGYAQSTIAGIAERAGISVESVYKIFGGKPGLVRALVERGLAGSGSVAAPTRSDHTSATETDPRKIMRTWGALTAEVSPLVAPLLLLLRDAAASDPALASVLEAVEQKRLDRMRHNAGTLAQRGFLRADVSVEKAADVMWTCTAPELYELLAVRRGWSAVEVGGFVTEVLSAALLPKAARPR